MAKTTRRFVAKAEAGKGWGIWNKKAKKWWGERYRDRPDKLIDELNGEKRPDVITQLSRTLQIDKQIK